MPKGSIRNPGTSKTMEKRRSRADINAQDKGVRNTFRDERYELSRTVVSPMGRKGALYDPELYLANRTTTRREKDVESAVAKSPRGGPGAENPYKALKRKATLRDTKKK